MRCAVERKSYSETNVTLSFLKTATIDSWESCSIRHDVLAR